MSGSNTGMGKMHLDLYTNNAALTQKARFWCNFVSSLKGETAENASPDQTHDNPSERESVVKQYRKNRPPSLASLSSQGLAQQSPDV